MDGKKRGHFGEGEWYNEADAVDKLPEMSMLIFSLRIAAVGSLLIFFHVVVSLLFRILPAAIGLLFFRCCLVRLSRSAPQVPGMSLGFW